MRVLYSTVLWTVVICMYITVCNSTTVPGYSTGYRRVVELRITVSKTRRISSSEVSRCSVLRDTYGNQVFTFTFASNHIEHLSYIFYQHVRPPEYISMVVHLLHF
jgi:hypothetical protein